MDSFESRMNPRFLAESVKGMLWEPRVIESGRGMVEGFKEDEKGKRRASVLSSFSLNWFSVIHVFMSSVHALSSLVRLFTSLRGADFWSCVSSAKNWWFTAGVVSYDIGERCSVQEEENGLQYWALRHTVHELWWWRRRVIDWSDWYLSERYEWNHWSAVDLMPKTEFRRESRIWWSIVSKAAERSNKRRTEMLSLSRAERISFTIRNKTGRRGPGSLLKQS